MGLLKPAEKSMGYLKAGLFGFQGSGKTYTAVQFAVEMHKHLAAIGVKPGAVAMFDTERGSDFAIPIFEKAGIQFMAFRGRAFVNLLQVAREAIDSGCSQLIIDSATHVWRELVESYQKKNNRKRLSFKDWGPIKEEWGQFTDLVVNAPIHMYVLGRAGYEYDMREDEDGKLTELVKTGTKFKAEGEFGFEPSIVFEMSRVRFTEDGEQVGRAAKGKKVVAAKGRVIEKHRATCVKDRNMDPATSLDGKYFDNPTFAIIADHLKCLNIGGKDEGLDLSPASVEIFGDEDRSRAEYRRQCEITEEEIKEALVLAELDGTSAAAKKRRTELLIQAFGTSAWTAITTSGLDFLHRGLDTLRAALGQQAPAAGDAFDKANAEAERKPAKQKPSGDNGGTDPSPPQKPQTSTIDPDALPDTY